MQKGYSYCNIHLRQRLIRRYASLGAVGALILGIWGFLANTAGVLGFFGITLESLQNTAVLVTPTPRLVDVQGRNMEVSFWTDRNIVGPGDCAILRWDVENADAVYLEGGEFTRDGVGGHDSRKACPSTTSTYVLTVEANGQTHTEARTIVIRSELPKGRIAFTSDRTGEWRIFSVDLAGDNEALQLTQGANRDSLPVNDWDPSWSPDGSVIAFESGREGEFDIFTYSLGDDALRRLTNHPGWNLVPVWSPQGDSIAFQSDRSGNLDIYTMKSDGSAVRRLTDHPGADMWPSWSPDGQRIVFEAQRTENGKSGLYIMGRQGGEVSPLLVDDWNNGQPTWSSNNRIAFYSDRDGNKEIYTITPSGEELRRITFDPAEDWFPAWSPNGEWLAFSTTRDGNLEVYAMDAEGNHLLRLTDNPSHDRDPAWSVP